MTPNEWRCGLCMLSTCGSDLPDNSNDFSIVQWLSMVTSSRIATATWPSKYSKERKIQNSWFISHRKFSWYSLSLHVIFVSNKFIFREVKFNSKKVSYILTFSCRPGYIACWKIVAMHITLKAEVTKNYTSMILYNYFFVYPICCLFYHGFAHVFKRWLLYVFFARHQRDTG